MPDDPTPCQLPDDARPPASRHPGFGPLCEQCGTAARAGDHGWMCHPMRERPELWADEWVDLAAFGLDEDSAAGWPEVRVGPTSRVMHGGFGPEAIRATTGPWVRHLDTAVPTWRHVAALAVLEAAGEEPAEAVARVIAASPARLDAWCNPRAIAIRTTGCGVPALRAHRTRAAAGARPLPELGA